METLKEKQIEKKEDVLTLVWKPFLGVQQMITLKEKREDIGKKIDLIKRMLNLKNNDAVELELNLLLFSIEKQDKEFIKEIIEELKNGSMVTPIGINLIRQNSGYEE